MTFGVDAGSVLATRRFVATMSLGPVVKVGSSLVNVTTPTGLLLELTEGAPGAQLYCHWTWSGGSGLALTPPTERAAARAKMKAVNVRYIPWVLSCPWSDHTDQSRGGPSLPLVASSMVRGTSWVDH